MISITLNDFIGFIGKSENAKRSKVRSLLAREEYSPKTDYWKRMRDGIKKYHRDGNFDYQELDKLLLNTRPKKIENFTAAINGYKYFLQTYQPTWFEPHFGEWVRGDLAVSVRPEVGLKIDGNRHLVKLYLNKPKLDGLKPLLIFEMMNECLERSLGTKIAILKVRDSQLLVMENSNSDFKLLLEKEAESFLEILKELRSKVLFKK